MLRELSIRNFAIIDDLTIRFSEGLSILSGETGAGKSIIISAVNLMLGGRATATLIRTGEKQAEIEALFDIAPESPAASAMAELGLDAAEGLLIRRIISANDRHRVYINGRLSTLQMLGAVTADQASISGQHAHQGLLKEEHHLDILDSFGGATARREAFASRYRSLLPKIATLHTLRDSRLARDEQLELMRFQRNDIVSAAVTPGEDKDLETERGRLRHTETLFEAVQGGADTLYGASGAVTERVLDVQKQLEKAGGIDPELAPVADRLGELAFQFEDVARDLQSYLGRLQIDPGRLEAVEERLDTLNRLKRRYGGSLDTVLERLAEIEAAFADDDRLEDRIQDLEAEIAKDRQELIAAARDLSETRNAAAADLCHRVEAELATLKMTQTRFRVDFDQRPADAGDEPLLTDGAILIGETGYDKVRFMMSPNVGEDLKPLAAIASGGELSRVVLAIKAMLSGLQAVETIIFDEVDAGIGGSVADVVGNKLAVLARHHQIICITHLPQIARFGHHHFRISKEVASGRTVTRITPLGTDERIEEIARMLGGEQVTPTTRQHARELINGPPTPVAG